MLQIRWVVLSISICTLLIITACGGTSDEPSSETAADAPSEASVEEKPVAEDDSKAERVESESDADTAADGIRTFVIVPAESSASYIVQEEFFAGALSKLGINAGNATVTGTSTDVAGQLQLNLGGTEPLGDNQFTVNLSTFATDQDRRDNWIRDEGPRFGSAPPAQFIATSIDGAPVDYTDGQEVTFTLNGDLTIRDITNQVSFAVIAVLDGDTITGTASTPSELTDWDIEPPSFANTLTVANEFEIRLDFTARE